MAIKGTDQDGSKFITQALEKGARAIISPLVPRCLPPKVSWMVCKDTRACLAQLAAKFYRHPSRNIKVIGVTGTNGKTTVSYLIEEFLKARAKGVAVIGTINYRFKDKIFQAKNTTPGAIELQSFLNQASKKGMDYAVIEVSSHALDQGRVGSINFSQAVFTNLSQDHLDYHSNMNEYFLAKSKLFKGLSPEAISVINNDDKYARPLIKLTRSKILTYAIKRPADIRASDIKTTLAGTEFILTFKKKRLKLRTRLIGGYNIYNILAALGVALGEKVSLRQIKKVLKNFNAPPGRLEKIDNSSGIYVYVDYAHTPAALENLLCTLRGLRQNKLIVVFGCGGERDRGKRPIMGRIASRLADYVIVTSDNPRREDPLKIIKAITRGMRKNNLRVIPRRDKAIFTALKKARDKDIILIAGKGHENYQVLKNRIIPFDDRKVVKEILSSIKNK